MREDIQYFVQPEAELPFYIDISGISYCDGTYRIHRENSPINVFEYVVKGSGTIEINGRKYTASAGDVYYIPENTVHTYYSDSNNPWEKIFVNVKGVLVSNLARAYGVDREIVFRSCNAGHLFRELYSITLSNMEPLEIFRLGAIKLHEIIIKMHDCLYDDVKMTDSQKVKNYIEQNFNHRITIDDISRFIYRSQDYTIKLFKKHFGITPYAYLLECRINAAKSLLVNTNLPIHEISKQTGFEDQHYFSNVFKSFIGISPKGYRNKKSD